jgi:hypothetical protein
MTEKEVLVTSPHGDALVSEVSCRSLSPLDELRR